MKNSLCFCKEFLKSLIIQIGALPDDTFAEACHFHNNVPHKCSSIPTKGEFNECLQKAIYAHSVILALGEMNKMAHKKFGISDNTLLLIEQLKKLNKKVIVVLFGTPYALQYFNNVDEQIIAYEDVPIMQYAIVDVLSGSMQATGKIPIRLSH